MSIFTDTIAAGLRSIAGMTGEQVVYSRGSNWVQVIAVPGQTVFKVAAGGVATIDVRSRDFIVEACDLVLNGIRVEPVKGDTITHTVNGVKRQFVVSRPDGDEQVFRFSDHSGARLRIHTQDRGVA